MPNWQFHICIILSLCQLLKLNDDDNDDDDDYSNPFTATTNWLIHRVKHGRMAVLHYAITRYNLQGMAAHGID